MSGERLTRVDPLAASLLTAVGGVVGWLAVVGVLASGGYPFPFLTAVAGLLALQAAVLAAIYRPAAVADGRPSFTLPTVLTIVRGGAIAVLAGFLRATPEGVVVWVPALLYAAAASLDAVDGFLARSTGTVTDVGARLDTEMDALGLLVGAAVAISVGMAPAIYLLVGLARYAFVAGIELRRWRGDPVSRLPESRLRRLNAAGQMAVLIVVLAPWPGTAASRPIATVAMVPFLLVFGRDWLLATGRREGPVR
ncbi:CDP-alcohol phosphatidyltransferase family protein [Halopenitus persicus]|uniref:CDP-alcohol phosphatidyltransferase family protein n=1 Tax=Halopenitus persicus TaxID=1048396 RepID=UPI0012FD4E1F|nr:CDP-alcohol phosphatidyltransferase family protein [Halopenitus persicus]